MGNLKCDMPMESDSKPSSAKCDKYDKPMSHSLVQRVTLLVEKSRIFRLVNVVFAY
jgi:hypothetical protein